MKKCMTKADLARDGGLHSIDGINSDKLLIVSASFEPRCTFAVESLSEKYRCGAALIYVNHEFLDGPPENKTRRNLYKLIEILGRHTSNVQVLEGSWLCPQRQLMAVRNGLTNEKLGDISGSISLDCTAFTRESLLVFVSLLQTLWPGTNIRLFYASADDHGSWLSRGFRCIRNVSGLGGLPRANRQTTLVVLSGFEPFRTQKLIEEHEPVRVLLGVGDPATSKQFLDRNMVEQQLLLARQDVRDFRFPVGGVYEALECLRKVVHDYAETNLVFAPMSTKFSTIATYLLAEEFPDAQISYCVPGEYNIDGYSIGVGNFYQDLLKPKKQEPVCIVDAV